MRVEVWWDTVLRLTVCLEGASRWCHEGVLSGFSGVPWVSQSNQFSTLTRANIAKGVQHPPPFVEAVLSSSFNLNHIHQECGCGEVQPPGMFVGYGEVSL